MRCYPTNPCDGHFATTVCSAKNRLGVLIRGGAGCHYWTPSSHHQFRLDATCGTRCYSGTPGATCHCCCCLVSLGPHDATCCCLAGGSHWHGYYRLARCRSRTISDDPASHVVFHLASWLSTRCCPSFRFGATFSALRQRWPILNGSSSRRCNDLAFRYPSAKHPNLGSCCYCLRVLAFHSSGLDDDWDCCPNRHRRPAGLLLDGRVALALAFYIPGQNLLRCVLAQSSPAASILPHR